MMDELMLEAMAPVPTGVEPFARGVSREQCLHSFTSSTRSVLCTY